MAQLVYPQSIDAGTPAVASEVQGNFVAARDIVNGQVEGARGGFVNTLPGTFGMKDLYGTEAYYLHGTDGARQPGVVSGLKVTPGAGLVLNFGSGFIWATDVSDVGHTNTGGADPLIPAFVGSGTATIASNSSGNPRIDQIIATLTDYGQATISVLQGTPTAAADLANRNGAAALPAGAVRLADILMPNAFAGPFVQNTHIRDRRPWAYGGFGMITRNANAAAGNDYTTTSAVSVAIDATNFSIRMESSGNPMRVTLMGRLRNSTAAAIMTMAMGIAPTPTGGDGGAQKVQYTASDTASGVLHQMVFATTPGSYTITPSWSTSAGTATLLAQATIPVILTVEELLTINAFNSGA